MRYDHIVMQLREDIWSSVLKARVGSHSCFHFFHSLEGYVLVTATHPQNLSLEILRFD